MYVRRNVRPSIILWFCWRHLIFFVALSFAIYWMNCQLHWQWVAVPFLPVGTIGTAVAFYIGFKNNSSYERLWEGRKIWGSIISLSRNWAMLVSQIEPLESASSDLEPAKQQLIRRQINWCDLLRLQLRSNADYWNHDRFPDEVGLTSKLGLRVDPEQDLQSYIDNRISSDDRSEVQNKINTAMQLINLQIADVVKLHRTHQISDLIAGLLLANSAECLKEQANCERLKSFPFPRQYAYFSNVFVWIFLLLLPSSLVSELPKAGATLDWMVIPFSTLISWIFLTMEQVGDTSEDPFEMGLNDVPITAICRNIERELLQMAGETNLPPKLEPVADILM